MKFKLTRRVVFWIAAGLLGCVGLGGWKVASVLWKSTGQFVPHAADPRVLYERGAEAMATQVATALPEAILAVEQGHYRPFPRPVRIYVCASMDSFRSYGWRIGNAGGFVLNQRLFLSPKPENTAERIPRILTHELSHLHLEQQLNSLRSAGKLPSWFKEGLAVHVSGGGGAENVTEDQARQSIANGRHFVPEATGSMLSPTNAKAFGLEHHMFYRQSGMFVAYLQRADEARFQALLLAIEDGKPLESAFQNDYGKSIEAAWRGFVAAATTAELPSDYFRP